MGLNAAMLIARMNYGLHHLGVASKTTLIEIQGPLPIHSSNTIIIIIAQAARRIH